MRKIKKVQLSLLLIGAYIILIVVAYNNFYNVVTSIVLHSGFFHSIQKLISPPEVRAIVFILQLLHIKASGSQSAISIIKEGQWQNFAIGWNCTGWQSLLILLISFIVLLQYKIIVYRKVFIILTGLIWMFMVNISRISLEIVLFHKAGLKPAIIFHDYFATLFIFIMFAIFWLIIYRSMLKSQEEKALPEEEVSDSGD